MTKTREVFKLLSLQFVRDRKPDQSGRTRRFSTSERNERGDVTERREEEDEEEEEEVCVETAAITNQPRLEK